MEPTSALSFEDLILRVAREAGISYHGSSGNERAMIPADDEHNLDLCKTIVNDGIRMFVADAPPKGWRWMRRIMSVTLTATRVTGTADAADATSLTDATLETNYDSDDDLNGWYIYILTGTGIGSYAKIDDYTAYNNLLLVGGGNTLNENFSVRDRMPAMREGWETAPVAKKKLAMLREGWE